METTPDHTHECRSCGSSIDCFDPSCDDHPGDCCTDEAIASRCGVTPEQVAGVRQFADAIGWTR